MTSEEASAWAVDRLERMFVGPPNDKGRQAMVVVSREELEKWRTEHAR